MKRKPTSGACIRPLIPVLLASMLCACGGSDGGADTGFTTLEQSVDSIEQPEGMSSIYTESSTKSQMVITPSAIDLGTYIATKADEVPSASGAAKIGVARDSAQTSSVTDTMKQLKWSSLADGGKIAAIQFTSGGAQQVRPGLKIDNLPKGTIFRTYSENNRSEATVTRGEQIMALLQANTDSGDTSDEARTWWAPSVVGEKATVEIQIPSGASASDLQLTIPKVVHVYSNPAEAAYQASARQAEARSARDSAWCNLDVNCYSDYAKSANGVIQISFMISGSYYNCTATLLNNTKANRIPYVATANHCISSQTVASSMESSWFFRSNSCNSLFYSSGKKSRNGAVLLSTKRSPDFTLLRLNDTPPTGATFVGWSNAKVANGTSIVGIHHPSADLQKISFGSVKYTTNCYVQSDGSMSCDGSNSTNGNVYRLGWSKGITETGSSGSALFNNQKFVGVLSGGSSTCWSSGDDLYSRFDLAFPALKTWLAPATR